MDLLKPPKLRSGDTIGVIAPSFPVFPAWHASYERGKEMLREMGFVIKEGRPLPIGAHARFDAEALSHTLTEAAVH